MSETLGRFDLTCGQCEFQFHGLVVETDGNKRLSGCPDCGRTVRVFGLGEV